MWNSIPFFYYCGIVGKLWSFSGKNIKGFYESASSEQVILMSGNIQPRAPHRVASKSALDPLLQRGHLAPPSTNTVLNGLLQSPGAWECASFYSSDVSKP